MSDATPPTGADSPDSPRGPTPRRGLWLAIMAMGIVVLALAALAINTAAQPTSGRVRSGLAPLVTPTYPSVTLPPDKATVIARIDATYSATWTAEAAAPTPTFTTGIFPALQDKYPDFYGANAYKGEINGRWEIVRPGTEWATPPVGYTAPGGYGAVRVFDAISLQLIGDYRAPDHSTWLDIVGVKGDVLELRSDKTKSFGFDMATDTFTR